MFRTLRKKIFRLALVSGAGAAANYFFDRDRGEQRRAQAKEKASGLMGKGDAESALWTPQTEHGANGFEPHVASTLTVNSPSVADVLAEPMAGDTIPGTAPTIRPVGS